MTCIVSLHIVQNVVVLHGRKYVKNGMKVKSQPTLITVCIPVAVWDNTAEPVLGDWSLQQESVGQDQADNANITVETSVIHPEPRPSWNTTSVRTTHALDEP